MFEDKAIAILNEIVYKDWQFGVAKDGVRYYFQIRFNGPCSVTGIMKEHSSRKWFLSEHMTKSEVVQTVFKAILTAEEHETREHFKYRNKRIFGPHIDVDTLSEVCDKVDVR